MTDRTQLRADVRATIGLFEREIALILDNKAMTREVQHEKLSAAYQATSMGSRPMFREAMFLRLCGLTTLEG